MPADAKTVLTTVDVAARLGCSDDQVRRMCELGRFDGDAASNVPGAWRACVGGHWRIPAAAVEHFLASIRARTVVRRRA